MKHIFFLLLVVLLASCEERVDYSLGGDLPAKPDFSIEEVPGDPNSFVVTAITTNVFSHVWDFTEGSPAESTLLSDTVRFKKKGTYDITLHVSSNTGSGTAFVTKTVDVAEDAQGCEFPFLPEDCTQRCWRLSGLPGGVLVGPVPYSGEWFTSPDITDNQADDRWCFSEDGTVDYQNNGASFSACQGYIDVEDYPIPAELGFVYQEGTGFEGQNVIELSDDFWMGVEDSGPNYGIVEINNESMTLLAPIKPCDGAASPGWFTIQFFAAE